MKHLISRLLDWFFGSPNLLPHSKNEAVKRLLEMSGE